LTVGDLARLADIGAGAPDPGRLLGAADALVQRVIGHKLFTVMRVDEATRVFVARTSAEIREAFPDYALIESLGLGSIMNVPISFAGRRVGVMNVSNDAGWFTPEDAQAARAIAVLLSPALVAR
jgi:GAF domain-containing protein